ncbi:MAG: serine acetyltransferase [Bacteroidetes bacterium]|nr:serine acetyltransferase [Bacteroidota bacterium]HOV98076.1 serine acetyltransferase [Bacteroidota bacterium]
METNLPYDDIRDEFISALKRQRENHNLGIELKKEAQNFIDTLLSILFPHFCKENCLTENELKANLTLLERDLKQILLPILQNTTMKESEIARQFMASLPQINEMLWKDAEAIYAGDPAAESVDEVILAYPGFIAIAMYRVAHEFYKMRIPIFPRLITEYAHEKTGIDIHPGAQIGWSFAIDHGTGIVIGESTIIGNNVKIYQGVTLGALSVDKKLAKSKRHPTIEDNVVIYAQAVILGGETVVGHHSVIGGNVWLTHSVPPNSVVYQEQEASVHSKEDHNDSMIY